MNLYFRLFFVVVTAMFRPRLPAGRVTSELTLLTLPNDLDLNLHVNNGRYLTLCDLNRVDLFVRTGLARVMIRRGWMPVIAEHTMTYRKPLGMLRRVRSTMHLTHWDEKHFYMTHVFSVGERIVAEGTSKGVVRSAQGVIAPQDVFAALAAGR